MLLECSMLLAVSCFRWQTDKKMSHFLLKMERLDGRALTETRRTHESDLGEIRFKSANRVRPEVTV